MTPKSVALAFSGHTFADAYDHIADDIVWNNIGGETFQGKDAVVLACDQATNYFSSIQTEFETLEAMEGDDYVVVESKARYIDGEDISVVASCDIYHFDEDQIDRITSYNIELKS